MKMCRYSYTDTYPTVFTPNSSCCTQFNQSGGALNAPPAGDAKTSSELWPFALVNIFVSHTFVLFSHLFSHQPANQVKHQQRSVDTQELKSVSVWLSASSDGLLTWLMDELDPICSERIVSERKKSHLRECQCGSLRLQCPSHQGNAWQFVFSHSRLRDTTTFSIFQYNSSGQTCYSHCIN